MPEREHHLLWTVTVPRAWPEPPGDMSVSTLTDLEACPRRWALAAAEFPELWPGRGYPPRLQLSALAGTVVHLAVEAATKALVRAGCESPYAPQAVAVLRELGGHSALLNSRIQRVLALHAGNPRAARVLDAAARTLTSQVPEMRTHLQSLLGRVRLDASNGSAPMGQGAGVVRERRPLDAGVYPELDVRAPQMAWRGKIDILNLSDASCEIIDFKTGVPQPRHAFQLRVYALLWSRDAELNPTGRRPDRLTLAYRSGEVSVDPLTSADLDALERELLDRTSVGKGLASARPPEARPAAETCRYCWVRQLCTDYWTPATQRRLAEERTEPSPFMDLELVIVGRHGPTSWDGAMVSSPLAQAGRGFLLRTGPSGLNLAGNDRIRILDAHVTVPADETEPGVATLGALSEVFKVDGP